MLRDRASWVHARYAPPDASVAAIKTERSAARPIDMSECGENGSITSPVDIFGAASPADGGASGVHGVKSLV